MADVSKLRLTLVKSKFHRLKRHQACLLGLGLRRMHHSVIVDVTPENRGMIDAVSYLLKIEEVAHEA